MTIRQLAVAVLAMAHSGAIAGAQPPIRIVVFDQAEVPAPTLSQSTQTARRILHSAGLETDWTICRFSIDSEPCTLPEGKYFKAIVRPNGAGLRKTYDGMGLALVVKGEARVLCYIFLDQASALAGDAHGSLKVVLGTVLAHEIGHLMGLKHSTSGIMKARLGRNEIAEGESGRLFFDSSDAKALRAFFCLY